MACAVLGACATPPLEPLPELDVGPVSARVALEPGTWAVLPPLGVVLVKGVEPHEDGGVYVLVNDGQVLNLPVKRAPGMGMRRLISQAGAAQVFRLLAHGLEVPNAKEYDKERTARWLAALRSGKIRGVAETFAALCAVHAERPMATVEQGLFLSAKSWLVAELATAQSLPPDDVEARLMTTCP